MLTSLQQLCLQAARSQRSDDRMALMKAMVQEAMEGPQAANERTVAYGRGAGCM